MEPKPWEIGRYLASPDPAHRIFVLWGPDQGLVKERAEGLARGVLGPNPDPFQIVRLNAQMLTDEPSRLADEMGQIGMFGGERVIRVSDAGQAAVTRAAEALFDGPEPAALVIFEAGDLKPSNKLRSLAARSGRAALISCYPDEGETLDRLVGEMLNQAKLGVDPDARAAIVARMGPDRQANRRMLETLITYKLNAPDRVTVADVEALLGDQSAVGYGAIAFAAFDGKPAEALALFDKSVAEKTDPEQIMASLLGHLDRFDLVANMLADGKSIDIAVKAARVGPKPRQAAFRRQVSQWPARRLATARQLTIDTQIDMRGRHSGIAELLCRNLILRLGQAGRAGRR